jgi:Helix-turn-helix domain
LKNKEDSVAIQKLYELAEVAETTGLKLGSVRQYVARGIIPALYLGRKRVVRADVLERICEEGVKVLTPKKEAV